MSFVVQKIGDPNGNEISFCPERGGIITSLKLNGKEVLYFDQETFNNIGSSVRGGIPILFPNAGEIPDNNLLPDLSRHGFARNMKWDFEKTQDSFKESLISNEETKKVYPYDFKLILSGKIENGIFILSLEIENIGNIDLPVSPGLHPYFYIPSNSKEAAVFDFKEGEYVKNNNNVWINGGTTSFDNPGVMNISIPSLGLIEIDASKEYRKIWFWSLPDKDFICIEPIMREQGGIINDPEIIKPGEKINLYLKIKLAQ